MRWLLRAVPLLLCSLAVHAAEVDRRIAMTIDDLPWALDPAGVEAEVANRAPSRHHTAPRVPQLAV